jgi:hypothetical protein
MCIFVCDPHNEILQIRNKFLNTDVLVRGLFNDALSTAQVILRSEDLEVVVASFKVL